MTILKGVYLILSILLVLVGSTVNSSEKMIDFFSATAVVSAVVGTIYWVACFANSENDRDYHVNQLQFIGLSIALVIAHFLYAAWTA